MKRKRRHVCALDGHVTVDDDRECLVCDRPVLTAEKVLHIVRPYGELIDARDIATAEEWGPAG
jgi:hypothetical protein